MIQQIRNKFVEIVAHAVDEKVDGKDITRKLDQELDAKLGPLTSERIQRGVITNLLLEMLQGLWDENPEELKIYVSDYLSD